MMKLWSELEAELERREAVGLRRQLRLVPDGCLDIASNDYLGLSTHPEVIEAAQRAAGRYGAGARASRLVSGDSKLHQVLEMTLASWKGREAALVFSSGFAANLGVITALAADGSALFCHKRNHASLIDACRLAGAQHDGVTLRFWETPAKLAALLEKSASPRKLIVADAVFSMDGDVLPLPEVVELAHQFEALLILDDAHGTGTIGTTGRGLEEAAHVHDECIVTVGTLSKALGSQGGFVVGPQVLIDFLVNAARSFIYSTGLNPAAAGAALKALEIIEGEPQRIARNRENAAFLVRELQQLGFNALGQPSPIIPVLFPDEMAALNASQKLRELGLWCPAIRPPTVKVPRLRLTSNAGWDEATLQRIVAGFRALRN